MQVRRFSRGFSVTPSVTADASLRLIHQVARAEATKVRRSQPAAMDYKTNVSRAARLLLPTALANLFEYLPVHFTILWLGHGLQARSKSSVLDLDGMLAGRALFNCIGLAHGFGLVTPLRTLIPQAYGASRPQQAALMLQLALLVLLVGFLPVLALLLHAEQILLIVGQPPHIAWRAAQYALHSSLYYFGAVVNACLQRVCLATGHADAVWWIMGAACLAHPALLWLLCSRLGFLGGAWAAVMVSALWVVLQIAYLSARGHGGLFVPLNCSAHSGLRAWKHYLWLVAPGWLLTVVEWWAFEAVTLLAGRLRNPTIAIAAMTIAVNVQFLPLMIWLGLHGVAATLVGLGIGERDLALARRSAKAVLLLAVVFALCISGALLFFSSTLAATLSSSKEVVDLLSSCLRCLALVVPFDALSNTLSGIFSGLGMQCVPAAAQLRGYYLAGLPIGIYGAFWWHGGETGAGLISLVSGLGLSDMDCELHRLGVPG